MNWFPWKFSSINKEISYQSQTCKFSTRNQIIITHPNTTRNIKTAAPYLEKNERLLVSNNSPAFRHKTTLRTEHNGTSFYLSSLVLAIFGQPAPTFKKRKSLFINLEGKATFRSKSRLRASKNNLEQRIKNSQNKKYVNAETRPRTPQKARFISKQIQARSMSCSNSANQNKRRYQILGRIADFKLNKEKDERLTELQRITKQYIEELTKPIKKLSFSKVTKEEKKANLVQEEMIRQIIKKNKEKKKKRLENLFNANAIEIDDFNTPINMEGKLQNFLRQKSYTKILH